MADTNNFGNVEKQFNGSTFNGDVNFNNCSTVGKNLTTVSNAVEQFVGRAKELEQIAQRLDKPAVLLLMNGMGGIGKSELARKFVQQHLDNYQHIGWVMVQQGIRSALVNDISLWNNLQIPQHMQENVRKSGDVNAFKFLLSQIGSLKKTLLVIDNADDADDLQAVLKDLQLPNLHCLITTRAELTHQNTLNIDEMEWQDAQAMFYEYAPNAQRDDKVLHQILNCVHRHTLLVELLAKVVQRERTPLSKVLEQLESADLSAHIVQNIKVDTSNHAHDKANLPKSEKIMAYLGFVFQEMNKLTDPQRNALKAFTLLPSMMEIEQNILEVMFEILNINASIDDLKALESLGYISYKGNNTWRTLHPLLSTVAFNELHVDINFATPFITGMVNFLYYDSSEVTHDFSQKQKQQGIGEHLIVRFKNEPTREMMRLYDSIYSLDQASGNNEKAKEHIETALHLAEKLGDAEDIAILQSNLANVYRDLGRYKEAKDLTEKALAFELEHFGEKHPTVVTNQSNLATVYTALGRHAEAEDLLKKALAFGLEYYGEKHQTVAICQNNLADVYHDLGRYKEAAVLKEKALAFELEHYGEKHVRVAISQSNLANVYKALGRHQEAAALLESALASTIANFREKNPMVATIQSNLANVYKALGRHQEAVALLEKALATNIEKFGEKHQTVAICQNNLAYPLWALGNKQRALTLWQSAYENYLSNFGPEHPRTQQFKKTLEYAKGKI